MYRFRLALFLLFTSVLPVAAEKQKQMIQLRVCYSFAGMALRGRRASSYSTATLH